MAMEPMAVFPDGEWDFISRMFSTEELDFTPEFLFQCSFPIEQDDGLQITKQPAFCPNPEANLAGANDDSLHCLSNTLNPNLHFFPTNSSNCSNGIDASSFSHEAYFFSDSNHILSKNDTSMSSMDFCIMDEKNSRPSVAMFPAITLGETACNSDDLTGNKSSVLKDNNLATSPVPATDSQLKRKPDFQESKPLDGLNKKPRIANNRGKKNVKKSQQKCTPIGNEEEERDGAGADGQGSASCSSEDDNASQDSNAGGATSESSKVSEALNSSGKARASRGSATDPQSLYARKRRERINERLRILQNLVPNGTKVDISTMLEEAVHYVKFLQLQIKLLSSDDLWMYAPIAYNGIDVGLNQKISMLL